MSDIFGEISIQTDTPAKEPSKKKSTRKKPIKRSQPSPPINRGALFIIFGVLTLAIGLYSAVGFLGVPYYLQHNVPQQLQLTHNLNLHTEKVSFNPFSFRLRAKQLSLQQSDNDQLLNIPKINARISPFRLLRMEFVFPEIQFANPSLNLKRNEDNSYNFTSLLPGFTKNPKDTQVMSFSDLPFLFSLNNLKIVGGTVLFTDIPAGKTHKVEKLEAQLPNLANIPYKASESITPYFSALVNGSPVTFEETSGDADAPKGLTWQLKDFELETYLNYLPFDLPLIAASGKIEGEITLQFDQEEPDNRFNIVFNLQISKFSGVSSKSLIKVQSNEVMIAGLYNPVKKALSIEKILTDTPLIETRSNNLLKDFGTVLRNNKSHLQAPISSEKNTALTLKSFEIKNGSLTIARSDTTIKDQHWHGLNLTINNYQSSTQGYTTENSNSLVFVEGRSKNNPTTSFSYKGTFPSPKKITGELTVDAIAAQEILSSFSQISKDLTIEGVGDLHGKMSLIFDENSKDVSYLVEDTKSSIKNLIITEKKKKIFQAGTLQLDNSSLSQDLSRISNITVESGKLFIDTSPKLSFLKNLVTKDNTIESFTYKGEINIGSFDSKESFQMMDSKITYKKNGLKSSSKNNFSISAQSMKGGSIEGNGRVSTSPFAVNLQVNFAKVSPSATRGLHQSSLLNSITGVMSGKGRLVLPQPSFTGGIKINDGRLSQSGVQLTWKSCIIENLNFASSPNHLGIGRIELQQPMFSTTLSRDVPTPSHRLTNYLRSILTKNNKNAAKNERVIISGTDIQELRIKEGKIQVFDNKLLPPWKATFTKINGKLRSIHSASSAKNSTFNFSGLLEGKEFTWSGNIDPFKDTRSDMYEFIISDLPLKSFQQQTNGLFPINLNSAQAIIHSSQRWKGKKVQNEVEAKITNLSPSVPHSDIALPLAMLQDTNGAIDCRVTTTSDAKDDNSLFTLLTGELQKKFIKGNISPLLLAKGDFTDLVDNDFIEFQPGQFMLSDTGRKTMARFGALLVKHPHVKLILSGGITIPKDKEGLHSGLEVIEKARVEKENSKLYAKWREKKEEFDRQTIKTQDSALSQGEISENDIPPKVLSGFRPLLPEPVTVDNEMLYDLAEKRLDIVKKQILTQLALEEERVAIVPQSIEDLISFKSAKGVHVEIKALE